MWVENCSPVLDKSLAPMGPEFLSSTATVLGLGSGGMLLAHCQTPVRYWISFSLRLVQAQDLPIHMWPNPWQQRGLNAFNSHTKTEVQNDCEAWELAIEHWDPNFPLENTRSPPHPENPDKLLKNYNLAHPGPVLKIAEKLLKND